MGVTLVNTAQASLGGRPSGAVTALVAVPAPFRVEIALYNGAGEKVRTLYSGSSFERIDSFDLSTAQVTSLNGTVSVHVRGILVATWDGLGRDGDPVSNGDYFLKMDVLDPYGVVTHVTKTVLVSRSLSTVEVLVLNGAGEVVQRLYREVVDAVDGPQRSVQLSTSILRPTLPAGSGPSSSVTISVDIPSGAFQATWDGTNEQGALVTNGRYFVEVRWRNQGEERTIVQGVSVLREAESGGKGQVTARPDRMAAGTVTTLTLGPPQGSTLTARLYNIAGELVRKAEGAPGTDRVDLDTTGLASGLYLAVVEVGGPKGLEERQVVRLMVQR
jgi:flagellar hook assembly protein FlgD